MRLYLIQHGEAAPEEVDPARPLTAKGSQDVKKIASFLKQSGLGSILIRHSGKLRAQQTAEILASFLPDCQVQQGENLAPLDPVSKVAQEIAKMTLDLILVGHLPHLGKLASFLLTGSEEKNPLAFRQGGVVCLERRESQIWQVAWMIIPDLIP